MFIHATAYDTGRRILQPVQLIVRIGETLENRAVIYSNDSSYKEPKKIYLLEEFNYIRDCLSDITEIK